MSLQGFDVIIGINFWTEDEVGTFTNIIFEKKEKKIWLQFMMENLTGTQIFQEVRAEMILKRYEKPWTSASRLLYWEQWLPRVQQLPFVSMRCVGVPGSKDFALLNTWHGMF